MRSRTNDTISSGQVHSWTLNALLASRLLKDHGWLCTATVVWNMVLRAASRSISLAAACRDLADGPCAQAVMDALEDGLPKTLSVLERRLNDALTCELPRRVGRRARRVAIVCPAGSRNWPLRHCCLGSCAATPSWGRMWRRYLWMTRRRSSIQATSSAFWRRSSACPPSCS